MRCEDFPCCGHTDGLPCDWTPPTEYPHAGCDHNAGYCQVAEFENDDDDLDNVPTCDECWGPLEVSEQFPNAGYVHMNSSDDTHPPVYRQGS